MWWKPMQNLGFCIKLTPSTWNHILHGETWFKGLGKGLSWNKGWYGRVPIVHTLVFDKIFIGFEFWEKKPYKQNQILKNILASGGSVILHHYPVKPLKVTL